MQNDKYYVQQIKNRVTMPDVIARYGFKRGRDGRIPCPFHRGEDNNLSCKADFFKCFVCGASGDVITFVQKYHGLSFSDTLAQIDADFHLGLQVGENLSERERLYRAKQMFEAKKEREKENAERKKLEEAYHKAYDELARLDRQLIDYRPSEDDVETHPLYAEALAGLEIARYELDCAERELFDYERRNN